MGNSRYANRTASASERFLAFSKDANTIGRVLGLLGLQVFQEFAHWRDDWNKTQFVCAGSFGAFRVVNLELSTLRIPVAPFDLPRFGNAEAEG